jgi:hypothetical protein
MLFCCRLYATAFGILWNRAMKKVNTIMLEDFVHQEEETQKEKLEAAVAGLASKILMYFWLNPSFFFIVAT